MSQYLIPELWNIVKEYLYIPTLVFQSEDIWYESILTKAGLQKRSQHPAEYIGSLRVGVNYTIVGNDLYHADGTLIAKFYSNNFGFKEIIKSSFNHSFPPSDNIDMVEINIPFKTEPYLVSGFNRDTVDIDYDKRVNLKTKEIRMVVGHSSDEYPLEDYSSEDDRFLHYIGETNNESCKYINIVDLYNKTRTTFDVQAKGSWGYIYVEVKHGVALYNDEENFVFWYLNDMTKFYRVNPDISDVNITPFGGITFTYDDFGYIIINAKLYVCPVRAKFSYCGNYYAIQADGIYLTSNNSLVTPLNNDEFEWRPINSLPLS